MSTASAGKAELRDTFMQSPRKTTAFESARASGLPDVAYSSGDRTCAWPKIASQALAVEDFEVPLTVPGAASLRVGLPKRFQLPQRLVENQQLQDLLCEALCTAEIMRDEALCRLR